MSEPRSRHERRYLHSWREAFSFRKLQLAFEVEPDDLSSPFNWKWVVYIRDFSILFDSPAEASWYRVELAAWNAFVGARENRKLPRACYLPGPAAVLAGMEIINAPSQ
jgi:hypothetical protein